MVAEIVLASSLAGAGIGFLIRRDLPEHHLDDESKDTIKQCFGLIATMVALVLGLLVASAKSLSGKGGRSLERGLAPAVPVLPAEATCSSIPPFRTDSE